MEQVHSIKSLADGIELKPAQSSNVKAVGYSPEHKLLVVQFHNGGRYAYRDVAPEDHAAFVGAKSLGSHFKQHVLGKYAHTPL